MYLLVLNVCSLEFSSVLHRFLSKICSLHADYSFDTDDTQLVNGKMDLAKKVIYIISIVLCATWLLTALLMPCAMKKVIYASMTSIETPWQHADGIKNAFVLKLDLVGTELSKS